MIYLMYKVSYKSNISEPRRPKTLLDLYFLSEICLLNVSHSRRTNLDFYRICGCSASTLLHMIQLCQNSMRDIPHFRRTYVDIYRICAWPVSHLPHNIQLFQHPVRDVWHFRRTYIDFYRICACPVLTLPRIIHLLPFRIALYTQSGFPLVKSSLCAGFAPIAFSTLVSYRAGRCLRIWVS